MFTFYFWFLFQIFRTHHISLSFGLACLSLAAHNLQKNAACKPKYKACSAHFLQLAQFRIDSISHYSWTTLEFSWKPTETTLASPSFWSALKCDCCDLTCPKYCTEWKNTPGFNTEVQSKCTYRHLYVLTTSSLIASTVKGNREGLALQSCHPTITQNYTIYQISLKNL